VLPGEDPFVDDGRVFVAALAKLVDDLARDVVGAGAVGQDPGAVVGEIVERAGVVIRRRDGARDVQVEPVGRGAGVGNDQAPFSPDRSTRSDPP
jgi:hypothetical protein